MLAALLSAFLAQAKAPQVPAPKQPGNVLLIVLDDVGVYDLGCYGMGSDVPKTPNLNALAGSGVLFRNAFSEPICSPSRAAILTGLRPLHSGVGGANLNLHTMDFEDRTIPELLPEIYRSAAIGKWHLSAKESSLLSPNLHGFDHFAGVWANLPSYYTHYKVVDGVSSVSQTYVSTEQVDDALAWIRSDEAPWFCYLAFTAAHEPFELPPRELLSQTPSEQSSNRARFKLILEALDVELGRLLKGLGPQVLVDTTVMVVGDNGTPGKAAGPELDRTRAKGTVYQGGVHVPLYISGRGVAQPGTHCDALVEINDLFATALELSGVGELPAENDSVSLVAYLRDPKRASLREAAFTQKFTPGWKDSPAHAMSAVRDARYKFVRIDGKEALFDLAADPLEVVDLTDRSEHQGLVKRLRALLDELLAQ